jgi:hypothetical protein
MESETNTTADVEGSASQRALQTVELFESIFQGLPFVDILSAKRVCKHWRNGIEKSLPLRQQLLLAPLAYGPTLRLPRYLLFKNLRYKKGAVYQTTPVQGRQWHPFFHNLIRKQLGRDNYLEEYLDEEILLSSFMMKFASVEDGDW